MAKTLMAHAFAQAGFESPRDRISRIVREAIETYGVNYAKVIPHITQALLETDAATVWEFFRPDREVRLLAEIEAMLHEMRRERGFDDPPPRHSHKREQDVREGQVVDAKKAMGGSPSGQDDRDGQVGGALSGHSASATTVVPFSAARQEIAQRSLLRTFLVNGTPIGDCTAARAREWGAARRQEGRFAVLLTEGLQEDMIIGEWKRDEDALEAARLAREDSNG